MTATTEDLAALIVGLSLEERVAAGKFALCLIELQRVQLPKVCMREGVDCDRCDVVGEAGMALLLKSRGF